MRCKCLNCGAELPEGASFCPHCTAIQIEKHPVKPPRLRRKRWLPGLAAVLALAAALIVFLVLPRPKALEGGAELVYTDRDGTYHVLLSFVSVSGVVREPQPEASSALLPGMENIMPSQLYVYREGTDALVLDEFLDKLESCTVEAIPLDGAERMACSQPVHSEECPYAALISEVLCTADSGTNEILWTLKMKNGDTLRLRHSVHASLQETVRYDFGTTPMDTAEELNALLAAIETGVDGEALVELYLPPVTYDGEVRFSGHAFRIYGGTDGTGRTTFTGPVTIRSGSALFSEISDVCFAGSGGTGLTAHSFVALRGCTLRGWDTGAAAQDGAWIGMENCCFEDNGVGLEFNTKNYSGSTTAFPDNRFAGNGTAVFIRELAGWQTLRFPGCTFSGNGQDIQNLTGHPIDLTDAEFE